jgi:moderate conductance mechanosensitive channel
MFEPLSDLLNDNTPLSSSWGRILVIAALFVAAWLLARASGVIARWVVGWHDRRNVDIDLEQTGKIVGIKRRETLIGIVRAGIAYAGFATAGVLGFAQLLGGVDRLTALAGASFVLILAGFAIQRVLTDIIAGLSMFVEGWYSVGDTILVPALELQGVVEDVSLRRTKLRTLDGEIIHVHNSQIPAVRVLPRGAKELAVEVFVTDRQRAEELVLTVVALLPEGPTTFVRRPWIERIDSLSETLHRIRVRATVVPGREWLVDGYFVDLLGEKASDGLIAHGPVALSVDESAARSYARASAETRRSAREARTRAA